jgi:hypothetical protein
MFIVLIFLLICIHLVLKNFMKGKMLDFKIYKEGFDNDFYERNKEKDF